jgi:lipopolysaccharide export LptBFGC system permease protein LptF
MESESMKRKWKLAAAIILTVVFGLYGFDTAIGGLMVEYDVAYCFAALLPFLICLYAAVIQSRKLKKERENEDVK